MKIDRIDDVIATRTLQLSGSDRPVLVEIGRPEKYPGEMDYFCPYRITGLSREYLRHSMGIDPVQALLHALQTMGVELYYSREYRDGKLFWFEQHDGDLGFPLTRGTEIPPRKIDPSTS